MTIVGGYRIHNDGRTPMYRVPDLLNEMEFKTYMAATFGVGVDFRDLTDEEVEKINSGEPIIAVQPVPLDSEVEIDTLREKLGIKSIEDFIGMQRSAEPDNLDPIVELDAKILTPEEFKEKYPNSPTPKKSTSKPTASSSSK